ncbi:MAG: macro domain-containing protein [Clostridia bacterium]
MPFTIVRQDITKMKVDAIVNAANTNLVMGGGVCGDIFKAAGVQELQAACYKVAPIKTGEAAITPGFRLPCKYIIHAAGPIYDHQNAERCEKLLRSAYTESLRLAFENNCESIAFPLISSGIYGYPKDKALQVATSVIQVFLADHDMDVYLVVFDKNSFTLSMQLLGAVASYIDENYVEVHEDRHRLMYKIDKDYCEEVNLINCNKPVESIETITSSYLSTGIGDIFNELDEPFGKTLLHLIDVKGKTDVEVYKRANIDRKLFSKIRNSKGYMPSKRTAIALAIALELSLDETNDLLHRAGYTMSHAVKFDVIVEYFITIGKYDVFEINEVLFQYDQPLLGG